MYEVGRDVSIALLLVGLLSFLSGLALFLKSTNVLYKLIPIPTRTISQVHVLSSFIAAGIAIIHIYLNRRALINYFKKK